MRHPLKLFKLTATRAGKVVFDDRIEAASLREARERMKSLVDLRSLTEVVYSITKIPIEPIPEVVQTKDAEKLPRVQSDLPRADIAKLFSEAAESAVWGKLRRIEQRLAALERQESNAHHAPSEPATNWLAVKKFYKKSRSPRHTAARFAVSVNTVKARARREAW